MDDVLGVVWRSGDLMEEVVGVVGALWNPEVWLPPNVTSDNFKEQEKGRSDFEYASFSDLLYPIPIALLLMVLRSFLMAGIFRPLGLRLGLTEGKKIMPRENKVLEQTYMRGEKLEKSVHKLAEMAGCSIIEVNKLSLAQSKLRIAEFTLVQFSLFFSFLDSGFMNCS